MQALFKKVLIEMKLSEIVKFLTDEDEQGRKLYTQTSLGETLGTNQSAVSQMLR